MSERQLNEVVAVDARGALCVSAVTFVPFVQVPMPERGDDREPWTSTWPWMSMLPFVPTFPPDVATLVPS